MENLWEILMTIWCTVGIRKLINISIFQKDNQIIPMSIFMTCFALDILRKNLGSVQHKKSLCFHLSVLQAKKILKTLDMH